MWRRCLVVAELPLYDSEDIVSSRVNRMKVNMGYGVYFRILTGCSVISDDSKLSVTTVGFYSILVLL